MKSSDKKQSLKEELQKIQFNKLDEKQIINTAIARLEGGQRDRMVLAYLAQQLRKLALERNLSKEGLDLLTRITRPNFDEDVAFSSITWF
ncbi:hypothetical protein [Oenococcus kitaharae]|uniref:hypothetical protein n=1 Tax=Oenococcus TaxID=46254 RepID=UPI0021E827B6|nr:hypothetical protein [Oenococcus kitaharae]MCV3296181.1 hypothetical protein [Oenococcus kitaharae]